MKTVFLRLLEAEDKAATLHSAIHEPLAARGKLRFEMDPTSFAAVPRSPFAYWVSGRVLGCFTADRQSFFTAKLGLKTDDDFRFIRLSPETKCRSNDWVPLAKGGSFSPFYADIHLLLNWHQAGWELKTLSTERWGNAGKRIFNEAFYLRQGLTWPRRTNGLSLRAMPSGCIFGDKGPAAFVEGDDSDDLLALAAVTNSRAFALLVSLQLARTELAQSYEVGLIQGTPIPNLKSADRSTLSMLARRAWSLKRNLDTRTETSHAFVQPALLQVDGDTLATRTNIWVEYVRTTGAELVAIQDEIDIRCFDLYDIDESDRCGIIEASCGSAEETVATDDEEPDSDDEGDAERIADSAILAADLISWAVGVTFGRFDLRVATGARALPTEPEPFDSLPVCSPSMLTGENGLPLISAPVGYAAAFPENGILVDDPGHARDLTSAVRGVFDELFGVSADVWWNDVSASLNPKDQDLRSWLASSFFEHHLKRYSKSRRKAPILWQLSVPSGRYSIWLYAHRLTRDSFFQLQNDVMEPKLAHEERLLTSMAQSDGLNLSARDRKEIAIQEAFVEELRSFLDEVKRVAPLWNPTLDDGVVLIMATLWRLVPQHKPWQRELKSKWDELVAGKYDWAHLAMHLWPERVIPKCATDRSFAIAHDLEDVFWVEENGKWKSRVAPTRKVDELVRERTSVAVKAALKILFEAPVANANGGRGHGRRAANTADGGAR